MANNKSKPTSRGSELLKCENEILRVFDLYKVTMPEGIFMFRKIEFTSLHNEAHLRASAEAVKERKAQKVKEVPLSPNFMFR